ncbi:MAG: patatin-like phospholipase family protein [Pseudomonas sp.]|nr:patatin-like phospholipase family protein [Pseudomonas sp.]
MTKRVALVLGSGGARGYAHIGVIEELQARGYEIGCIAGCSMGAVVGGIYAAGKLREYREWTESLDYLDVLRLLDVSFRLGAIRGEKIFGKIRELVGEINIEDLSIPYTAVATDLTNQQEIWFQEGCLHQAMRASAAIPSLFTPVVQGNRMLVDGGLLNPLPIVPVVASHCDLIIAVNLSATNQKQYQLPIIERPPALKNRFDLLMESLGSRLPFKRKGSEGDDGELLLLDAPAANAWLEPVVSKPQASSSTSANGSRLADLSGPASLLDVINQSFEVMQTSLAQYKIAGYPPDILINIPKRVCRSFEFYKAPELIQLGRIIAHDTLDKYERDNA